MKDTNIRLNGEQAKYLKNLVSVRLNDLNAGIPDLHPDGDALKAFETERDELYTIFKKLSERH